MAIKLRMRLVRHLDVMGWIDALVEEWELRTVLAGGENRVATAGVNGLIDYYRSRFFASHPLEFVTSTQIEGDLF